MRLATILTPHGPRAAIATADSYVDLHATDPGLPVVREATARREPGDQEGRGRCGGITRSREVCRERGEASPADPQARARSCASA